MKKIIIQVPGTLTPTAQKHLVNYVQEWLTDDSKPVLLLEGGMTAAIVDFDGADVQSRIANVIEESAAQAGRRHELLKDILRSMTADTPVVVEGQ